MSAGSIGEYFDDPDALFNWMNNTLAALATTNTVNRAGVTGQLLGGEGRLAELAQASAIPADKLARLLDFLAGHGLLVKSGEGEYCANERTRMLQEAASFMACRDFGMLAGTSMLPALRLGVTPFEMQFGMPVFDYFRQNPAQGAEFADFMGFMTRRTERFIFANHTFKPFETVADIGGSMGNFLCGLLKEYPGTKGILFDLPEVVERARPVVEASALAGRISIASGSFFEAVPRADLYTLKQILHDWDDAQCCTILSAIRAAIPAHGRLAVIDHLLADQPAPDEAQSTDVAMMLWDTGRERKLAEFETLFAQSGFLLDRVTRNPSGHNVLEAIPV